ncbi:Uncharacterised protein [Chlamydia trachomatis]|nr:Uncharacterised protein [Chlamydia trachomatis]CQB87959.1 Uncharacterised protein [Chlamydia trachomatis]
MTKALPLFKMQVLNKSNRFLRQLLVFSVFLGDSCKRAFMKGAQQKKPHLSCRKFQGVGVVHLLSYSLGKRTNNTPIINNIKL